MELFGPDDSDASLLVVALHLETAPLGSDHPMLTIGVAKRAARTAAMNHLAPLEDRDRPSALWSTGTAEASTDHLDEREPRGHLPSPIT